MSVVRVYHGELIKISVMEKVKYILNAAFYYVLGGFIAVCIFGLINLLIEFLKLYIK